MLPIFVILHAAALLASLGYLGHILVYAPQAILILPPSHNANDLENYIFVIVILRTMALSALFGYLGHILVYAPQAILILPPSHNANDLEN